MHLSVEASLKKLRTIYIDLLYVHWWDWDTSVEEVMRSLHTLVLQGKVLYLVCPDYHSSAAHDDSNVSYRVCPILQHG